MNIANSGIGEIIITNDFALEVAKLKESIPNTRIFPYAPEEFKKGEFKIKHAREALDESIIAETLQKTIILAADKFNIEAQNALLKVLEEPPQNVKFILVAKYKSAILPTILSRLILTNKRTKSDTPPFPLDITRLNLEGIMGFLEGFGFQDKREEIRTKLTSLLFAVREANLVLNRKELDCFSKAMVEIESYEQPRYIFLKLLLMLLEHKKRRVKG